MKIEKFSGGFLNQSRVSTAEKLLEAKKKSLTSLKTQSFLLGGRQNLLNNATSIHPFNISQKYWFRPNSNHDFLKMELRKIISKGKLKKKIILLEDQYLIFLYKRKDFSFEIFSAGQWFTVRFFLLVLLHLKKSFISPKAFLLLNNRRANQVKYVIGNRNYVVRQKNLSRTIEQNGNRVPKKSYR